MPLQLMIAEDQETVRLGLKSILHRNGIHVAAMARSGEEAIELAKKRDFDVALLDVRLPRGDGLHALSRIKSEKPALPVVMFSVYENPNYIARAVALGAAGYLLKEHSSNQLVDTIHTVALGGSTWTKEELRRISGALTPPKLSVETDVPLTQRETEVLRLLSFGRTNKEIAAELQISYETVKEHVQHILRKIGVTDRTQAAVWAVRKKLI